MRASLGLDENGPAALRFAKDLCDAPGVVAEAVVALSLAAQAAPSPHRFLAVDAHRHRATITLIASYDGDNGGFNFDGYSRYLMWTVPRGWTVRVVCENRGSLRHSCAVVRGAGTATPAFRGAATPRPVYGLQARTARFSFRAAKKGVYRFASLVSGDEVAGLWDVLKIARGGKPTVVDLRAG